MLAPRFVETSPLILIEQARETADRVQWRSQVVREPAGEGFRLARQAVELLRLPGQSLAQHFAVGGMLAQPDDLGFARIECKHGQPGAIRHRFEAGQHLDALAEAIAHGQRAAHGFLPGEGFAECGQVGCLVGVQQRFEALRLERARVVLEQLLRGRIGMADGGDDAVERNQQGRLGAGLESQSGDRVVGRSHCHGQGTGNSAVADEASVVGEPGVARLEQVHFAVVGVASRQRQVTKGTPLRDGLAGAVPTRRIERASAVELHLAHLLAALALWPGSFVLQARVAGMGVGLPIGHCAEATHGGELPIAIDDDRFGRPEQGGQAVQRACDRHQRRAAVIAGLPRVFAQRDAGGIGAEALEAPA